MRKIILHIILLSFVFSCSNEEISEPLPDKINPNLQFFGFTLIDVGWDDPSDANNKTNYIDEVAGFSNVADMLVVTPTDNIIERLLEFDSYNVKSMLHLNEIFFEQKSTGGSKSGFIYGLRADYKNRWDTFIATNDLNKNFDLIACFYIGEEPSWNGISEQDFQLACDYAKQTVPMVPIFNVEAYPDVSNIYTPGSVDWVGFDHYFLKKPSENAAFIAEYNTMKSRMKSHQRIILIMDSHWIKILHGSSGISQSDMDVVARDYYHLANNDPSVAGIVGYFWPSGFDLTGSVGARNLPDNVKSEYSRIGRQITGK